MSGFGGAARDGKIFGRHRFPGEWARGGNVRRVRKHDWRPSRVIHDNCWISGASHALPAALLAMVLLTGCSRSEPPPAADTPAPHAETRPVQPAAADSPSAPTTVTLTEADADRAVALQPGQVVEIRLQADRAAGFSWVPAQNALPVLSTDGMPRFEGDERAAAGASGTEVWRFIGREAGHAHLVMEYRRLAEPDAPPRQAIAYHFDVE